MNWFVVILICVASRTSTGEIKEWVHTHRDEWIQSGSNQKCAESRAVHPQTVNGLLYLKDAQDITDFVLPANGEMVLLDNSQMVFSPQPGCEKNKDYMLYNNEHIQNWFSSSSWKTHDEDFNAAKAHMFRIPCECDTIRIDDSGFSIDLQMVDEIVFDRIVVQKKRSENDVEMTDFLLTSVGQRMFTNSDSVRFVKGFCRPPKFCGCHNRVRFDKYESILCEEERHFCETPLCMNPIQPAGHCCPICGGTLDFRIQESCDFNMTKLQTIVAQKLKRFRSGKFEKKIHVFAGMIPGVKLHEDYAQLVVTEIGEYSGISVDFLNYLVTDPNFRG